MARESHLERHFNLCIKELGGLSIKMIPTVAGVPDRLVLLPGGRSILVELKAEGGTLHEIQKIWHSRAADIGHQVIVLKGKQAIDAWIADIRAEVDILS